MTGLRIVEPASENLALGGTYLSPASRRPLLWDRVHQAFATVDGDERFACLAGEIPDLRVDAVVPTEAEIASLRARLATWWEESEGVAPPPETLLPASPEEARRYWWLTAKSEAVEFLKWCARGCPPYTQRESMRVYRTVTDVYPNALRRRITVLAGGQVATAPIMVFKRLSLEPVFDLIRRERVRSVLDFGCGWGANTIVLRQAIPDLEVWSFDYSPQRVLTTQFNLERLGLTPYRLFVADGSRLPLPDGSVDLVFTTHVLEQMREVLPRALREIHRVARRFAWHVEPTYRYARWPHRLRMLRLGYPRDIAERVKALGWKVLEHRPASPAWGRNPGELIALEKRPW